MIGQSAKMAVKAVWGNKLRSFLTMLGIIIGVFALVVLVSLVNGATDYVTDTISSLGGSYLSVSISDDKGDPLTLDDINALMDEEEIGLTAPLASLSVTGKAGYENGTVYVYGTTPAYQGINNLEIEYGSFLRQTDVENNNYVVVINQTMADELFGTNDCLGESLTLNGTKFTVIGILADDDNSMTSTLTSGMMVAYVPYTTARRMSSSISSSISSFYITSGDSATADEANDRLTEILLARFNQDEDAFTISDNSMIEEAMGSVTNMLETLLGGIAAISLIVGGIGIMNIMLVSVTERTKEIGIRKAIGAGRGVILTQFLIEALIISLIGCALGLALSWVTLKIVSALMDAVTFSITPTIASLSVAFCLAIGLLFGLYPANKAANKPPIEALRYEG
ncbi:MAG: ABC transporter permease [Oscillospiraceae bacterium]|nr:ABC transporter permease [Oscillospiraceae bacterium]